MGRSRDKTPIEMRGKYLQKKETKMCRLLLRHVGMIGVLLILLGFNLWGATVPMHYRNIRFFGTETPDGRTPAGPAVPGGDGWLYGTTLLGGKWDHGIIFRAAVDGSGHEILRHLGETDADPASPQAGLVVGLDQRLYGTTVAGGTYGKGTVYSISRDGVDFTVLHSFSGSSDGSSPVAGLLLGSDDLLYGTAYTGGSWGNGTLFRLAADGTGFTVLHNFGSSIDDGKLPQTTVIELLDGSLCGTTLIGGSLTARGVGTIYRIARDGTSYSLLHKFGGSSGSADLFLSGIGQATNGLLFGTTARGGDYDYGTLFRLATDGSAFEIIHHFRFSGSPGLDGAYPIGALVSDGNGALLGTTQAGGLHNGGTIYRIGGDGTSYSIIHEFYGFDRGATEPLGMFLSDADLFVTAAYGCIAHFPGHGGVVRLNADGSGYFPITAFRPLSGEAPPGDGLVRDEAGNLYGTLRNGGLDEVGSFFTMRSDGTGYQTLHSFSGIDGDGRIPTGKLLLGVDGFLYGTTSDDPSTGGTGRGTIYRLAKDGTFYEVIHRFGIGDDTAHSPQLLNEPPDGYLYGAAGGGTGGQGILFRLRIEGSAYEEILDYGALPASTPNPAGGQIADGDALYGTAPIYPGASNFNLFRLSHDGAHFEIVGELSGLSPGRPNGELIDDGAGTLFGLAVGGVTPADGAVYLIGTDGTALQIIHTFGIDPEDGRKPNMLFLTHRGQLAGTTRYGGTFDAGVAFVMNRDGGDYTILRTFGGPGNPPAEPSGAFLEGEPGVYYGGASTGGPWNFGSLFRLGSVLSFESSVSLPTSGRRITMHGDPGLRYVIEVSPGLEAPNWNSIDIKTVGQNGKLDVDGPEGVGGRSFLRFIPDP